MFVKVISKNIEGFSSKYRVNNFGQVISTKKDGFPFYLKPTKNMHGYLYVTLDGKKYTIHNIITRAFFGLRPKDLVVNHVDGVKTNNNVENLEYVTRKQNVKHAHDNGLTNTPRGLNHWSIINPEKRYKKLTKEQVLEIRKICPRKISQREAGRRFKINRATIRQIIRRETWKHL